MVVFYWLIEQQIYYKYENNRQREGTTVLDTIKKYVV